ncbi:MAG: urea ABC transporter ATP-binding protein UrtD [Prochlorotrichaceae cyanobacterium]
MSPILDIQDVTVSFDGFKALKNLTFNMEPGELRVIIGPNGAGKTTFLDVITGKVKPTTGIATFKGKNLVRYSEHEIAKLGIGRKFQTPRVYLNLTPRQNLELSCNSRKNLWNTLLSKAPQAERRTVGGLLETIGLMAKADIPAQFLSHGEKQWLEIGMLVAQSPDLLLVDEPVAGLTDEETAKTGELLLSLAESHSIIVIEHDMEFVRQIARTVTVLHEGTVLCEGSMAQVQNDPKVIEVYLGEAPTLTTEQFNIIRIAASMAWADANFEPEEQEFILDRLSLQFSQDKDLQNDLKTELRNYLATNVPLEQSIAELATEDDRKMALRLGYEVLRVNGINEQESQIYQNFIGLLNLPTETVHEIEQQVNELLS